MFPKEFAAMYLFFGAFRFILSRIVRIEKEVKKWKESH